MKNIERENVKLHLLKKVSRAAAAAFLLAAAVCLPALSAEKDAVILYTNDVHCAVDGYAALAAYRSQMVSAGHDTIVVDAGDFIQGEILGTLTKGAAVQNIMNSVPYDAAAPGNHEFDYGIGAFGKLTKGAKFAVLSCNFTDLRKSSLLLPPYRIYELGGRKIALVGVTTPESLTKSTPKFFQNSDGQQIYGFCPEDLYAHVQSAVDAARNEGAQTVILLGHLGVNGVTEQWSAPKVIAGTRGIDAVIDGHSHEVFAGERYKNADGKEVLYTQTGTKFMFFGKMTVAPDGAILTELIHPSDVKSTLSSDEARAAVQKVIDGEQQRVADLKEEVGVSEVTLTWNDPATGEYIARRRETNLGDFAADAYRAVLGTQIALVNGGGLRDIISEGSITRLDLMNVNPWNNKMCIVEIKGQDLLDLLEFQCRNLPDQNTGGFLHVSGMSYEADATVPSPVKLKNGVFDGIEPGQTRRVKNVCIGGEPLDPDRFYKAAASRYILLEGGDGTGKLSVKVIQSEGLPTDAECLVKYVAETLSGRIPKTLYGNALGSGRIVIHK